MKFNLSVFKAIAVILLVSCAALPAMAGKSVEKQASKTMLQGTVNINMADATQLQLLPGIGPKAAESIVSYRGSAGPFKSVDDLVKVKGVGPKTLEKIRPYLSLKGETTLKKVKKG
jgi:competence protein ComEA